MDNSPDKLAIIVGPTASGKTAVSVRLAQLLNAEIISGDSMQVYRGMDIGTAKISAAEMAGVPHHLLDIRSPREGFSVADFRDEAQAAIKQISERGHLPLVVGGTGLYISSLINPYLFPHNTARDDDFRARKLAELQTFGAEYLHGRLAEVDAQAARRIHAKDHYRVIRALEVFEKSGQTISEIQAKSQKTPSPLYQTAICGLMLRRELLYPRIEQRVEQMIDQGLVEEVKRLLAAHVPPNATSMQGLGYRHIAAYLRGICTFTEALAMLKRDTRRFAKRQYTWFKRDARIKWFDVESYMDHGHDPCTETLAREMAAWIKRELSLGH
ncbi:MAG: tRNA (adenosine(37)-N6)-dimethylallyltransferase MiaA [Clostridiales bacterium]|nr:tRNA (adenosine(37)-N6)-dimethylallyltransferase MiaA [Clostridiales bacterium]